LNADGLSTHFSTFRPSFENGDGVELFTFESIVHLASPHYAFGYLPQQPQPAAAYFPYRPPNQSVGFVKDLPPLPDSLLQNGAGFVLAREKWC
jgi:hypothetical protein